MKRIILLLGLYSPAGIAMAQDDLKGPSLVAGYDDVSAGRNLSITYHQPLGQKWEVYGGIKYFLNSRNYKNVHSVATPFFKEFYADKLLQHAGFKSGLQRQLWEPNKQFSLYAFYELQHTQANVISVQKYWFSESSYLEEGGPSVITAWEQSIGLSANIRISNRLALVTQAGIGFTLFTNNNGDELQRAAKTNAFTRMFSFSLRYHLKQSSAPYAAALFSSRQSLSLAFDNIQTGRTLNLSYRRALNGHHSVYGGIKVQINSRLFDDHTRMEESYYFKQFHAKGFGQHLGLKAGYEYGFAVSRSNLYLFGFYDLQLSRAMVRNLAQLVEFSSGITRTTSPMGHQGYIIYRDPSTEDPQPSYRYIGPVTALENYVGLGAKMGITPQLQLRIQAGIGYNFYSGPGYYDPYYVLYQSASKYVEKAPFDAPKSELSKMFSLGLDYAIGH